MKIEFGSGKSTKPGWEACDIRPLDQVKYVCNCWEIDSQVPDGAVEEIYSRHMFEHLTFKQGEQTLISWYKILKPGGVVNMNLPDLKFHVDEYLQYYKDRSARDMPSFEHAIAGFYGWQREEEGSNNFTSNEELWDVHKSGYDQVSLKLLVEKFGYRQFVRNQNKPWHLDVTFYK